MIVKRTIPVDRRRPVSPVLNRIRLRRQMQRQAEREAVCQACGGSGKVLGRRTGRMLPCADCAMRRGGIDAFDLWRGALPTDGVSVAEPSVPAAQVDAGS